MKLIFSIGAGVLVVAGGIAFALITHHARVSQAGPAADSVASDSPSANAPAPSDSGGGAAPDSNQPAAADNSQPSGPGGWGPGSNGDGNGQHRQGGQRGQRMQQIFAQLDLTDAQKQQIAQIRQTVTDRREARQQIMAVLTPDQRAKFDQLRAQFRGQHGQGGPGGQGGQGGQGWQGQPGAATPTPAPAPAPATTSAPVPSST